MIDPANHFFLSPEGMSSSGDALQSRPQPENLPADFEPSLIHLDDLIGEMLLADVDESGAFDAVADRLFAASVAHLPKVQPRDTRWRFPRFAEAPLLRTPIWSRLAMAACVGMAFVVGAVLMHSPQGQPGDRIAVVTPSVNDSGNVAIVQPETDTFTALSRNAEWLLLDSSVAYLLDTRDMTLADLARDIARVAGEIDG
ncbi:MAG TPA: hypothetical protein PK400_02400 [Phycisphaerales bacterium]|nr:hypothetical protein [Phycisphaerales bacterium]HRQ75742.1 hypothetical protein [Phycisphaerales bacterium]